MNGHCLGAAGSIEAVLTIEAMNRGEVPPTIGYSDEDIARVDEYLSTAPTDIPIFVLTHFPLHFWGDRLTRGNDALIDVFNKYPNVVLLWGHNHSDFDEYYDNVYRPGSSIVIDQNGTARTINFTYLSAGCISDLEYTGAHGGSAWVQGKGLICTINADGTLTFNYYDMQGDRMEELGPYLVEFREGVNCTTLSREYVDAGQPAEAPEVPEIYHYRFTGWDNDFDHIAEHLVVTAEYEFVANRDENYVYLTLTDGTDAVAGKSGQELVFYPVPYTENMTVGDAFQIMQDAEYDGDQYDIVYGGYGGFNDIFGQTPENGAFALCLDSESGYVQASAMAVPGDCYYITLFTSADEQYTPSYLSPEETTAEAAAQPGEAPSLTDDPAPVFPAPAKGDIVLWNEEKESLARILIPGRPNESETAAAALLAEYLEKITGVAPETVNADTAGYLAEYYAKGNAGAFIVLSVGEGGGKTGGYTMKTGDSRNLYITGNDPRGLFNGVYDFLREYCGVNLYSADVITAPHTAEISVPAELDVTYAPVLEYADTDFISPHNPDFAVANGLNGIYSPIPAEMGGSVKYITFAHSLTTSIVPAAELLESNPEYFALQENGKRTGDQLCLSNPNVVNRAIGDVLRLIDEGYDDTAPLNIISVTQNDNRRYCTCENCAAIAERYGGQSGLMLWFVNQIADAVAASDHPDVVVDTFAYQYTRQAPTGIKPKENVCVRLCSIECCFAHALSDPACERNAAFMQDLRDWSALSDRLYIWDYTTNYSQTIGLFPDFGVLQKNAQAFAENSVVGVYEEGAYYAAECNTEFADLRAYLLARFLRDPYESDPTALRNGFLAAYYGDGAEEIGAFLDYITEHAGDADGHLCIYYSMADSLHGVTKHADRCRLLTETHIRP